MRRFLPSLLATLLVLAPALSGCADEFVTDAAGPSAAASAKAPGCTYSIVGDTLVEANSDHLYSISATGSGCNGYYQNPRWRITDGGNGTIIGHPQPDVLIHAADVPGGSYEVRARVYPANGGTVFLAQTVQIALPPVVTSLTVTASPQGLFALRLDWSPCAGTADDVRVTRHFQRGTAPSNPPPSVPGSVLDCDGTDMYYVLDANGPIYLTYEVEELDALGRVTGSGFTPLLRVSEGA